MTHNDTPGRIDVGDNDVHSLAGAYYDNRSAVLVYAPGVDPDRGSDYAAMPEADAVAAGHPIVARASEVLAAFAGGALEDEEADAAADMINVAFLRRGSLEPGR